MKSNIILKNLFAIFRQISKSGWNGGDGDGENFLIGNVAKMK